VSSFNQFAGRYSEDLDRLLGKVGANTLEFARNKAEWLIRLAEKYQGPTRHLRILDLGCGTGNVTMFLQSAFKAVVGADISHELLQEAVVKAPRAHFVPLGTDDLPFADGEFNVAFCAGVFHHMNDDQLPGICAQLARVLAPGGVVVIFEHNPYNPLTRKIVRECELDWDVERLLPQRQTRELLTGAGLEVVNTPYISFFPGSLKQLRPLETWMGWLPLGGQYLVAGRKPLVCPVSTPALRPQLSLVLPMYNESANAVPVSLDLLTVFREACVDLELVLVNNGSRDDTGEQLAGLAVANREVKVVTVEVNQGFGWGVICGLWAARGVAVGHMGGDGQVAATDVLRAFRRYQQGDADLVKVTRVVRGDGWNRILITKIYNILFRLLFGLPSNDVNGTPKIFRRDLLPALSLESKDWFLDAEIYQKIGMKGRVAEVPIEFRPRSAGRSHVRASTLGEFLRNMFRFWAVGTWARLSRGRQPWLSAEELAAAGESLGVD